MIATLDTHYTLDRNGAKSSVPRHDRAAIDPQEVTKRTPIVLKLVRRVIVRWSVNLPFQPTIQFAVKTKCRVPEATQDTGRTRVVNRMNDICQFTGH
jgi:hypothetical protein